MKNEHILKAEVIASPFNSGEVIFRASKIPKGKSFKIETDEQALAKVRKELKELNGKG